MKLYSILFACLIICCFACSKNETTKIAIEDCAALADAKILTEEERGNRCLYLEVYQYQSALYTLCECCVCDKIAIPTSCDGNPLCTAPYNCLSDFYEEAEYLFSVSAN